MLKKMMNCMALTMAFLVASITHAQTLDTAYAAKVAAILEEKDSHAYLSNPPHIFNVLRNIDGKSVTEEWIYYKQNDFQTILIISHTDVTEFREQYYLLNHALIHGTESENDGSSVDFDVRAGRFINLNDMLSHRYEGYDGQAEKEIMARYKKRMKQLQQLLKQQKRQK